MESIKPKNKTRNLIITVCAAVVVVVVALVVFMNVNTQRIIDQNTQYLETSTNQTVRRVNDTFSSSLQSAQTAAVVYGDAISDEGFNPHTAATILDNAQFDHTFFIDAQGTAYNNDGTLLMRPTANTISKACRVRAVCAMSIARSSMVRTLSSSMRRSFWIMK